VDLLQQEIEKEAVVVEQLLLEEMVHQLTELEVLEV
jgi:hypothetical protein